MRGRAYLKDFIYGAIDGAVTTFAVVSGVTGAGLSSAVVIVLGIANLVADGFSMAVSNYLGTKAELQAKHFENRADTTQSPITRETLSGARRAASVTFLAFVTVGAIPLLSYMANWLGGDIIANPFFWSCLLTGVAFFLVGAMKSRYVAESWLKSGVESLAVGGAAALIAYGIGVLLKDVAQ